MSLNILKQILLTPKSRLFFFLFFLALPAKRKEASDANCIGDMRLLSVSHSVKPPVISYVTRLDLDSCLQCNG